MKQHSERFLRLVQDTKAGVREIDADAVRMQREHGVEFHLVDVREDNEWHRGRLPGAIHIGKGILERDIEKKIPDTNAPIVLYCGGGFRSALAADALQRMGYTNVSSMSGGYSAWIEAGKPVVTDE